MYNLNLKSMKQLQLLNECSGGECTIFCSEMWWSRNIKQHKMEMLKYSIYTLNST